MNTFHAVPVASVEEATTALQALLVLNDPTTHACDKMAADLAGFVMKEAADDATTGEIMMLASMSLGSLVRRIPHLPTSMVLNILSLTALRLKTGEYTPASEFPKYPRHQEGTS